MDKEQWRMKLREFKKQRQGLELSIHMYSLAAHDAEQLNQNAEYYNRRLEDTQNEQAEVLAWFDALIAPLEHSERKIMTAYYIEDVGWDYINHHVPYGRRQAIRIRDKILRRFSQKHG